MRKICLVLFIVLLSGFCYAQSINVEILNKPYAGENLEFSLQVFNLNDNALVDYSVMQNNVEIIRVSREMKLENKTYFSVGLPLSSKGSATLKVSVVSGLKSFNIEKDFEIASSSFFLQNSSVFWISAVILAFIIFGIVIYFSRNKIHKFFNEEKKEREDYNVIEVFIKQAEKNIEKGEKQKAKDIVEKIESFCTYLSESEQKNFRGSVDKIKKKIRDL